MKIHEDKKAQAAIDAQLKQPNNAPSIGMILCKTLI